MVNAAGTPTLTRSAAVALMLAALIGCASEDMSDIDAFMEEKRARPGGVKFRHS